MLANQSLIVGKPKLADQSLIVGKPKFNCWQTKNVDPRLAPCTSWLTSSPTSWRLSSSRTGNKQMCRKLANCHNLIILTLNCWECGLVRTWGLGQEDRIGVFLYYVKYQSVSQWIDIEKVKLPQGSAWDLLPVARCQVLRGPNKCEFVISCQN